MEEGNLKLPPKCPPYFASNPLAVGHIVQKGKKKPATFENKITNKLHKLRKKKS